MNIIVVGLNHKTADVEVRERLAFNGERLIEGLEGLLRLPGINGVLIISTCNRVEIFSDVKDPGSASETIKSFLVNFHSINRDVLDRSLYILRGREAIRHIFRVASSLDSMVVGEPQILGQLKDAFEFALQRRATDYVLNKVMKKAISVAKRVRTETRIAENAVSISFAAVELAKKIFTDLSDKAFMLLGAGEMAELAARHLISSGVKTVLIANRTFERGCELAKEFNGRAVRFEDFLKEMTYTDILICSTGAPDYVLRKSDMHALMKERRQKPMFLIDISVPRNIDPSINELNNVYLYDVDDLQGVVDANIVERKKEAEKAEMIIEEEIESLEKWAASLDSIPTVIALRNLAENIKKEEIQRIINKFPALGEKEKRAIDYMASSIINKLLHPPTVALKEDSEDRETLIATIRKLYGLNGEDE